MKETTLPIIKSPRRSSRCRLEPELEFICQSHLAEERLEMAKKFERWARQIRMSLTLDFGHPPHKTPRPLHPREPRKWQLRNN